ncbi:hypothetical protein MD273_13645 [Marinobacter pelagius]|uniref:hypothetical protein n=1 Tax=Marinobacter sp. C7 TaxID=2951363 RepID=UPI001EEFC39C|nr:hypothetical protein [Marinobacter sp. C7]MCG7200773.1 hypothetical protein [Marinobacter sp. C7]
MRRERTGMTLPALMASAVVLLTAPGLTAAHGGPAADEVPEDFVKASITRHPDIQGLSALILDAPRPGIMLRYQGDEPLTVLGTEGEKFLRFTRDAVEVNVTSSSWKNLPNAPKLTDDEAPREYQSGSASWRTLSRSGIFGWLDPRLSTHEVRDQRHSGTWSIAVETPGSGIDHIRGELAFKPIR